MLKSLQEELDQKTSENIKLEINFKSLADLKLLQDQEISELKKKVAKADAERDLYKKQFEMKDDYVKEIQLEKKILEQDNVSKTRLLKERQELTSRTYVNSAIENQKRIYEAEIENRNIKIEMLEANLKAAEQRMDLMKNT